MVRFIILREMFQIQKFLEIYIPIWLDLLYYFYRGKKNLLSNLHSNMVRFIIMIIRGVQFAISKFTFQYG